MTRSRDVADTQDNNGGPVSPLAAGKNAVINGGFDIWQRGTSFTTANNGSTFGPDRWNIYRDPGTGGTVSRQTSGLTNFLYSCRVQRDSGTTGTAAIYIWQNFESQMTYPLAGKTIVFSYYARAGANFSPSGSVIQAQMITGTGTDQNVLSGYTGAAVALDTSQAITTTWTRYSHVITLNSNVTEICPRFYMAPSGTAGANDWFEVTGIQIEVGSVPTTFTRAGGTIANEFSVCQRYYEVGSLWREGTNANVSSYCVFSNSFLVQKRANATMTFGNVADANANISSIDGPEAIYSSISPFSKNNLQTGFAFRFIPSATTSTIRQYWTASAEL